MLLALTLAGAVVTPLMDPMMALVTAANAASDVRCAGERATMVGTAGRDLLTGTPGRDVIAGLRGNDRIAGLGGGDLLCGGHGSDTLVGGDGQDRLYGGLDLVRGGAAPYHRGDWLVGGRGDDLLAAGHDPRGPSGGGDVVSWAGSARAVNVDLAAGTAHGEGRDRVRLVDGKVYLSAYADTLVGSDGSEEVHALRGDDEIRTGGGDDRVYADGEEDAGDDIVLAGPGDDHVTGSGGTDEILGGDGRDLLLATGDQLKTVYGGAGRDVVEVVTLPQAGHRLAGGEGLDRVLVEVANSTGAGSILNLGTGELVVEGLASTATGFEDAEVYFGPFRVVGTDGPNRVITQDDVSAVMFEGLGGDDAFGGGELDDHFDGGPGEDTYLADAGGTNTCIDVEHDPLDVCAAP